MTVAAPHLHEALRAYCLAAFARIAPEAEQGEIPFVLDERGGLYEYRPLLRDYLEERAHLLVAAPGREDRARRAAPRAGGGDLRRGAGDGPSANRTLFRAILLPLLVSTGEACGGFDWEDGAFDRVYGELEHSLFGTAACTGGGAARRPLGRRPDRARPRASASSASTELDPERQAAPLGVRAGAPLRRDCRRRPPRRSRPSSPTRSPRSGSPRARRSPPGRSSSSSSIASARSPAAARDRGDRAGRRAEPARPLAREARRRPARHGLPGTEHDAELGEALERWELSLFEDEPLRSERLREALAALLGGADGLWAAAMRAAVLVGEIPSPERERSSAGSARWPGARPRDAARPRTRPPRLRRGDPRRGPRPAHRGPRRRAARPARRPAGYFSARASAA